MKIPRVFQIGLLLLLVAVSIQTTIAAGPHRRVRGVTTLRRHRNRTLQKGGAMGYDTQDEQPSPSPTPEPTVEETEEYYDDYGEEPKKAQEKDLDVVTAKENDDDKDISTDSPTDSSSMELTLELTLEPTGRPTTLAPTAEPTSEPTPEPTPETVEQAKEAATPEPAAEETPEPIVAATEEPQVVEAESPTPALTELPKQNGKQNDNDETEPTDEPAVEAATQETQAPSASSSTNENIVTTSAPTGSRAYSVRLDPLYMTVEMKGDFHEVGFMEVLIGYMETNMARDFKEFQSISYGISTFSQITQDPSVVGRAQHNFTDEEQTSASQSLVSNVTVHVHLLTATFTGKPPVSDAMIEEYMTMLLENPELLQEYVDSQPNLDATIYSVSVEFESVIPPTYVQQDGTVAEAQIDVEEDNSEGEDYSVGIIAGVTLGCFLAIVWMLFLYGRQSRAVPKH